MVRHLLVIVLLLLPGCVSHLAPPGPAVATPAVTGDAFVMPDGARLPYRAWLPDAPPRAVVLALHGMNDSRDAWELPAPVLAEAGIAVFAPDQRGFGDTASRGYWATTEGLADDAVTMAQMLRARFPDTRLILMGESMGAAVLLVAATGARPPPADGYVLIAPAVWGRAKMNLFMRAALWLTVRTVPGLVLRPDGVVRVVASDNREALRRLSSNPLTIRGTRVDAAAGLVDLMDAALAAAPSFQAPALLLYGGQDTLIPDRATQALWRSLPEGPVRAFYADGYHLLLRDLGRGRPIGDIVAWINGGDATARAVAGSRGKGAQGGGSQGAGSEEDTAGAFDGRDAEGRGVGGIGVAATGVGGKGVGGNAVAGTGVAGTGVSGNGGGAAAAGAADIRAAASAVPSATAQRGRAGGPAGGTAGGTIGGPTGGTAEAAPAAAGPGRARPPGALLPSGADQAAAGWLAATH